MSQRGSHCEEEASPPSLQVILDHLTRGPRNDASVNIVTICYHNAS